VILEIVISEGFEWELKRRYYRKDLGNHGVEIYIFANTPPCNYVAKFV
jgi:hypothetical protein